MRTTTTTTKTGMVLLRRRSSEALFGSNDTMTMTQVEESCCVADDEHTTKNENAALLVPAAEDALLSTSSSSSSSEGEDEVEQSLLIAEKKKKDHRRRKFLAKTNKKKKKEAFNVETYIEKRVMTANQERWNAVSVLPGAFYCLYFVLSGRWMINNNNAADFLAAESDPNDEVISCLEPSFWHSMPAWPPLAVVAVAAGIVSHAPFSFLYHWKYAVRSNGNSANNNSSLNHWSRRADQSMIHACSALLAYATSGSALYFLVNCLYNAECIFQQCCCCDGGQQKSFNPQRNQRRIGVSLVLYTAPIVWLHGDWQHFWTIWCVFGISGWLFATYPVGGYSHTLFHFVIALVPPLLMETACRHVSAPYLQQVATQCS